MSENDLLSMSVRQFAAATADKTPTPGGGSVAGVVGALATALGEMTLNFTRGKKKYAQHDEFHAHLGKRLLKMRGMFEALVADDVAAYSYYQEVAKRPDGPQKDSDMQTAVAAAINVPREAIKLALALMDDLLALEDKCSPMLISDLVAGAVLAVAAAKLSSLNVRINAPYVSDRQAAKNLLATSNADLSKAQALLEQIERSAAAHLDRDQG